MSLCISILIFLIYLAGAITVLPLAIVIASYWWFGNKYVHRNPLQRKRVLLFKIL